ncbi:MAG: ABC transporter ATP-binding protein [candidate division Zixibacteria bacterium]|nr:ABC transporter ATP-binding protein [candidate division Zixibacteria bacterium]
MSQLRIKSLNKNFSGRKVLEDISIETSDGELVVILGPSGCGKSTLLRLISGLDAPESGEIYIGDRRVDILPPQKRNVALVFQNYALYPHMTVAQNLAFPLKIARVKKEEINRRVETTAQLIGLADRMKTYPSELSGGQRQRVALGRAIIRQPDIYLLDEPLSNLDADLRARMRHDLVELQRKLGTTTIYVTHDQTEALTMADRLIVMESGKIRQTGTPEEIYSQPADIFVASFLGLPKINLIDGDIGNNLIQPFDIPASRLPQNYNVSKVVIGLRPEDIVFLPEGKYSGIVKGVEYMGDRAIVLIEFGHYTLIAVAAPERVKEKERILFNIRQDGLHLFDRISSVRLKQDTMAPS